MTTIKSNDSKIDNDILISVNTVNLTKKECENLIKKDVTKYAYKYLQRNEINIIQFGIIIDRATLKLADTYELDKKTIKKTTEKYISRTKAKQARYAKKQCNLKL